MPTLSEIKADWSKDSKINDLDLSREALRGPSLHSKYLDLLVDAKRQTAKHRHDLAKMQALKVRYWNGLLSKAELEQYGLPQYQYAKPMKAEIDSKLAADDDCIDIQEKIDELEIIIYTLESIMKSIASRGWDIRNAIEWNKFQAGS